MRKAKALAAALAAMTALLLVTDAMAKKKSEAGYSSLAVQNRKYFIRHELTASVGFLPMDAFTKGFTIGGGYTLHFNEVFAWEIGHFTYSFPIDTDLKDDLAAFDLKPTPFEVVKYFVTTNFVFKPIYFKGAALNDSLVYGEIYFVVGGGFGWFTRSNRPAVDYGFGIRLFASTLFSFKLDVRHIMFMTVDDKTGLDVKNELFTGLSASLSL